MTPLAHEIHLALNQMDKMSEDKVKSIVGNLQESFKSIVKIYREMLFSDPTLFERLYISNFNKEEKLKAMSRFLKVPLANLQISPDQNEIEKMTLYIMTCDGLAQIFSVAKVACNLDLKEFVISWFMMNDGDEMRNIMFDMKVDPEKLDAKVKKYYLKEKEAREIKAGFKKFQKEHSGDKKNDG